MTSDAYGVLVKRYLNSIAENYKHKNLRNEKQFVLSVDEPATHG